MSTDKIRLLYIDDEESIREMALYELRRLGFDVCVASSGSGGLALFRESLFPIVACDLKMPGMNGLEVLQKIKAIDSDAEVLMATGFGSQEDAIACLRAGAYDYIYKPFNMHEFAELVQRAWERRNLKAHLNLYECIQPMSRSLDLKEVLQALTEGLKKNLPNCDVFLEMAPEGTPLPAAEDLPRVTLQETGEQGESGKQYTLSAALFGHLDYLGSLSAHRQKNRLPFSESDKRALMLFASHAASAIENARLYQTLQKKVDEIEQTREQLIQAEKLSAVGRLAAGVSHEINNPLTGIMGQAQILLMRLPSDSPYREDIAFIESAAQRCRTVVQNLLQFSRGQKLRRTPTSLAEVIRQSLLFVRKAFSLHNIEIQEHCEESLPLVSASPVHLMQVILNLLQNAFDAMGTEGTIQIRGWCKENTVRISITDTGPGISPEALLHIFKPFYTTKEVGKGTGLGLSVSLGIMHDHQGSIEVQSPAPGQNQGTEFTLVLPMLESTVMDLSENDSNREEEGLRKMGQRNES